VLVVDTATAVLASIMYRIRVSAVGLFTVIVTRPIAASKVDAMVYVPAREGDERPDVPLLMSAGPVKVPAEPVEVTTPSISMTVPVTGSNVAKAKELSKLAVVNPPDGCAC